MLSPEAEEQIAVIQRALDSRRSFDEMAMASGATPHKLQNLYYRRTQKPLEKDALEGIIKLVDAAQDEKVREENLIRLENMPMSEVLREWCNDLGVGIDEYDTLADLFGVSAYTIRRWSNNECRATGLLLLKYRMIAEVLTKELEESRSRLGIAKKTKVK